RCKGIAVVELEPGPELELVRLAVRALLPRLGEARPHLVWRIGADQSVVDRVEDGERGDLGWGGRGIEPGRRDRHMHGDRQRSGRRLGPGLRARSEGDDSDGQQPEGTTGTSHDLPPVAGSASITNVPKPSGIAKDSGPRAQTKRLRRVVEVTGHAAPP